MPSTVAKAVEDEQGDSRWMDMVRTVTEKPIEPLTVKLYHSN
jgi:hypothetical protein